MSTFLQNINQLSKFVYQIISLTHYADNRSMQQHCQ